MADQRREQLVKRLYEKTRAGEINWGETSVEDEFQVTFPEYTVRLTVVLPFYAYHILLYDAEGRILDDIYAKELETIDGQDAYEVFKELYDMARRRALKADEAIDHLLQTLRS